MKSKRLCLVWRTGCIIPEGMVRTFTQEEPSSFETLWDQKFGSRPTGVQKMAPGMTFCGTCPVEKIISSDFKVKSPFQGHLIIGGIQLSTINKLDESVTQKCP